MAERVVNRVAKKLEEDYEIIVKPSDTENIPLCGNEFKKYKYVKKYIAEIHERLTPEGFSQYDAWYLVTNYGKQTESILNYYAKQKDDDHELGMAKAELKFSIENEMVQTPMDFFIRRTGRLYFDIDSIRKLMEPLLAEFKIIFKLEDEVINSYRATLEEQMELHSNFSLHRI